MKFSDIFGKIASGAVAFGKWLIKKPERILILILLLLAVIFYGSYRNTLSKYNNIIREQKDTITLYQNKAKELYAANTAYITDLKNLKQSNEDLYAEVKKLKDNPIVVTKTVIEWKVDSIYVEGKDTRQDPADTSVYISNVNYNTQWFKFNGRTTFNVTNKTSGLYIDNVWTNSDIYIDLIEKGKNLQIVARATNPYLQINNTEGIMLSPESSRMLKKRFDKPWALVLGIGGTATLVNNQVKVYPGIQLTLGYKLLSF